MAADISDLVTFDEFITHWAADRPDRIAMREEDRVFTYAELEENEEDLVKLRNWLAKITLRDAFGAPRRAATLEAIASCEQALEEYAARVYAEEADGH